MDLVVGLKKKNQCFKRFTKSTYLHSALWNPKDDQFKLKIFVKISMTVKGEKR